MFTDLRKGRGQQREKHIDVREKHQLVAIRMCPDWELNPQPRYMPWAGIEPANLQPFGVWDDAPTNWTGHCSNFWGAHSPQSTSQII